MLKLMCTRLRLCFDAYGVDAFDVPKFFKPGEFLRSDYLDDKSLIDAMTDEGITQLGNTFNINPEWLLGRSDNTTPPYNYHWYKSVGFVAQNLAKYSCCNQRPKVYFVAEYDKSNLSQDMANAAKRGLDGEHFNVGIVICRTIDVSGVQIPIYDVLGTGYWDYVKSRSHLKLLMLFCKKTGLDFSGVKLNHEKYNQLFEGQKLPAEIFNNIDKKSSWSIDGLLSEDPEINPEFEDLSMLLRDGASEAYDEHIHIHENAILAPWKINDLKAYLKGDLTIEIELNTHQALST